MQEVVRYRLLASVILVLALAALAIWSPIGGLLTAVTGPPVFDHPEYVTIGAPQSGSQLKVTIPSNTFTASSVDTQTQIRTENVTTGAVSTWASWHATNSVQNKLIGSFGDLLLVRAKNGTDEATEEIGYVPTPSDSAPPDLVEASITGVIDGLVFKLSGPTGVILDNSFPVVVELFSPTDSANDTISGNGTSSTEALSASVLNVEASAGDRILVVFRDNVGNETELVFIADRSYSSDGDLDFHAVSPNQSEAEAAGTAGMIAAGDGASAVTAFGRDFLHTVPLMNLNAPIVGLPVALHYRSGIAYGSPLYDGPVGIGWDWALDARIEYVSGDYYWYPGDGRRIGPFEYESLTGGLRYYDSPKGVFLELTTLSSPAEAYLTALDGSRYVFGTADGLLIRIEDRYAYTSPATNDSLNRVVLTRNDDDRVVRATLGNGTIATFGWFDCGRLASVRYQDRVVELEYGTSGNLESVVLADGSSYAIEYAASSSLLATVEESGSPAVTIVENTYASSSPSISKHRNRHNPSPADDIEFSASGSGTQVIDAVGAVTIYAVNSSVPHELDYTEFRSDPDDRNNSTPYPGTALDMYAWRVDVAIHADNYLRSESKLLTSSDDDTWASPTTTDSHKWTYVSPTHSDPRMRARVGEHQLFDPAAPSTPEFTESWDYGGHGSPDSWPSSRTNFDGVETLFTYNAAGQLLTTEISDVTLPSGATGYDIVSAYDYDDNGRQVAAKSPNRSSGATQPWSTINSYYASGVGFGRLAKAEQRSSDDDHGPWSEYVYDSFGNVIEMTRPDRAQNSDASSIFEYDELDRQISSLGPEVHLTHDSAVSTPIRAETLTVFEDFRVSEVKQKHFDEFGAAGVGSSGEHPAHTITTYEYDDSGRVDVVNRDLKWDGTAIERSRSETVYTARGEVASERVYSTSTIYATTNHTYDARGLTLSTSRDPDDGGSQPAIVTWYRYDGAGRTLEQFENETGSDFHGTSYDVYGRQTVSTTPFAYLTAAMSSSEMGMFRTLTDHNDGTNDTWRPTGSRKQFLYLGGSWADIAEDRSEYDEAGRQIRSRTWFRTDGSTRVFSNEAVDHYPDGTAQKTYLAYEDGSTTWTDFYHESVLDDFERVSVTRAVEDGVTLSSSSTVFDDSEQSGWVTRRVTTGWNEAADPPEAGATHSTDYLHDELGRVVVVVEFGTEDPEEDDPIRRRFTHYGGMGQVYETVTENESGSESGVITRTTHDFAGRPLEERRGFSVTSGIFETRRWSYDMAGRRTAEHRVKNPGGSESVRTTTYSYDQLGRVLEIDSPEVGGSVMTYGYATGTFGTLPSHLYENEFGIDRLTISNQLGHPLIESVTDWGSIGSAVGASAVEYTYGSSTGCGCISSGSPTLVETKDASDAVLTSVEREYDPRGAIAEEKITVFRPVVDPIEMVTTMEYDAAGRRTTVVYPERPRPAQRSSVTYDYRMDGRVRSMKLDEESLQTKIEVASYLYDGSREALRKQYAYSATSSDWIAETGSSYDPLGRPEAKSYSLNDATGCDMGFESTFASSITSRDIDGRVTELTQIPRTASADPLPLSMSYDGAGNLASQSIPFSSVSTPLTVTTSYFRDAFELYLVEEDWDNVGTNTQCATPPDFAYTRDWSYSAGAVEIEGVRPAGPPAFFAENEYDAYLQRAWYDHRSTRNALGWTLETRDFYYDVTYCGCDQQSAGAGFYRRDFYRVEREFEHDAWGRVVVEEYQRTWLDDDDTDSPSVAENGEVLVCETGISIPTDSDDSEEEWTEAWPAQESMYDGFGRLVFSIRPMAPDDLSHTPTVSFPIGLYHAYADGAIIQSRGCGDDTDAEPESHYSHIEYFNNPATGQPDKVHLNRDDANPTPEQPGNPWNTGEPGAPDYTGSTFATPIYDVRGNLALMNGVPTPGGLGCTGEGSFPATARAFDMSGGDIESGDGTPVVAEAFACGLGLAGRSIGFFLAPQDGGGVVMAVGDGGASAGDGICDKEGSGWKTVTLLVIPGNVKSSAESDAMFAVVQSWIPAVDSVWKQCCITVKAEKSTKNIAENPLADQAVDNDEYKDIIQAWSTLSADKVPTIAFKGGRRFSAAGQKKITGATVINKESPRGVIVLAMDRANAATLAHEIGHALGQRNEDEDPANLMYGTQKRSGTELRWKLLNNLTKGFDQCELFRGSSYAK